MTFDCRVRCLRQDARCDRASAARAACRAVDRPGCRPPRATAHSAPRISRTTTVLPVLAPRSDRAEVRSRWSLTSLHAGANALRSSPRSQAPGKNRPSASHTIRLATSPSVCPPRPSATTHSPISGPLEKRVLVDAAHPADVGRAAERAGERAPGVGAVVLVGSGASITCRHGAPAIAGPRAIEECREGVGMWADPSPSGNWARRPTTRRSTTSRPARRASTRRCDRSCDQTEPKLIDRPQRHLPAAISPLLAEQGRRACDRASPAAAVSRNANVSARRRPRASNWSKSSSSCGQGLDHELFGLFEKRATFSGGDEHPERSRSRFDDERQRKVAADAIDARHHHAKHGRRSAHARARRRIATPDWSDTDSSQRSPSAERLAAMHCCSHASQRSTNASDARRRRKSPWLNSLP